jgi:hypothetical protein
MPVISLKIGWVSPEPAASPLGSIGDVTTVDQVGLLCDTATKAMPQPDEG